MNSVKTVNYDDNVKKEFCVRCDSAVASHEYSRECYCTKCLLERLEEQHIITMM